MATTTIYPVADGSKANWTGVGDTSNLWANVDEDPLSPTDADYNKCDEDAYNSVYTLYLRLGTMPGDFGTATGVVIHLRVKYVYAKVHRVFDKVQLVRTDESTAVTAEAAVTTTSSPANSTYSPAITGGTDSTTWNDLALKLNTTATVGSVLLYATKVVVTYAPAAASGQPAIARQHNVPHVTPRLSRRLFNQTGIAPPAPPPAGFGRRGSILVPAWLSG